MRPLFLLLILPLAGCAGSLNPLYESKDDLLDPKPLLGVWQSDQGRRMVRASLYEGQDTALDRLVLLQMVEDPRFGRVGAEEPRPADTAAECIGGLVKIGDEVYLDLTVSPGRLQSLAPDLATTAVIHLVQVHTFVKITTEEGALRVRGITLPSLDAYLAKNPKAIAYKKLHQRQDGALIHLVPFWKEAARAGEQKDPFIGPSLLFTAEPAEMRQFLAQHGKENLWADGTFFTRGKEKDFERRWQKLQDRIKDAEQRRKKDETPPRLR